MEVSVLEGRQAGRPHTTAERLQIQMQQLKFVYGFALCLRGKGSFYLRTLVCDCLCCGGLPSLWVHQSLRVICHYTTYMPHAAVITGVWPNVHYQRGGYFLSLSLSALPHFWLLISLSLLQGCRQHNLFCLNFEVAAWMFLKGFKWTLAGTEETWLQTGSLKRSDRQRSHTKQRPELK